MSAYAFYRLPYADNYIAITQNSGDAEELRSPTELCGKSGFVIAPFAVSDECPLLIIKPDTIETRIVGRQQLDTERPTTQTTQANRVRYSTDFANYHSHLLSGEFKKIVLARTAMDETDEETSPLQLFERACQLYPRMFVALVSTKKSGTWLTATPETLLEGSGTAWRTMALAGTMKLNSEQMAIDTPPQRGFSIDNIEWSMKNRAEQRLVAVYITELLERFTNDFSENGPYTVRAGNLVHLRSDFNFTLSDTSRLGELINALHPTPAVCGLPKDETYRFILENEQMPRRYYSGFMGPLRINGETHLHVSLRCMEILGHRYRLYAGGGLLDSSTEDKEWRETEAKMETMRQCLQTRRTSTY